MPGDIIVDLNRQSLSLDRVPDILNTGSGIGKNLITNAMLTGIVHPNRVDIGHFLDVLFSIGREKTCPPASLFLEAGKGKGFLEGDFSEHVVCVF